jgi:hypothetical protein
MSEWCIHLWLDGKPCEFCGQPADEPCPSSCGVDIAAPGGDKTAYTYYFGGMQMGKSWAAQKFISEQPKAQAHAMSHPKAQERRYVTDAAWERIIAAEPDITRDEAEQEHAKRGCMTVTVQEWEQATAALISDEHHHHTQSRMLTVNKENGVLRRELATLRARNEHQAAVIESLQKDNERLRVAKPNAAKVAPPEAVKPRDTNWPAPAHRPRYIPFT